MMKAETLDLELKTFNHIRTERIFLSKNQFEVLAVVAQALDQMIAEYITDSLLSMMECDIEETVTRKLKDSVGILWRYIKDDVYFKNTKQICEMSYLS